MALTDQEVSLILGAAGLGVTYLGTKQFRTRRAAKDKLAADVKRLIDSYKEQVTDAKEQVTYLRAQLEAEKRRRGRSGNDQQ